VVAEHAARVPRRCAQRGFKDFQRAYFVGFSQIIKSFLNFWFSPKLLFLQGKKRGGRSQPLLASAMMSPLKFGCRFHGGISGVRANRSFLVDGKRGLPASQGF
jgi:hypothetical protein